METISKGLQIEKNNNNGFTVAYLHYDADPKKDAVWAAKMRRSYPGLDIWSQEMELDFTKASGKRVYPEFKTELHCSDLKPDPYREIWRGWDFGYHHPAVVWGQVNNQDRLMIFAELLGEEIVINKFAEQVKNYSKVLFPGWEFKDAGDPAVRQRTDKNERTTADILRQYDIRIQSRPTLVKEGINTIRNLLLPLPDGSVRFKIDNKCKRLIDGFLGGYCRNEDTDEPEKDGFYEHLFDALRYMVVLLFNPRTYAKFKPVHLFARPRVTINSTTGY